MLFGLVIIILIVLAIRHKGEKGKCERPVKPYDLLVEKYINKEIDNEEFIRKRNAIKNK